MRGMIKEFKEFAVRGNVIDLAVGVIVGASFGKITTSLVNDIVMPPIGLIIGGFNFKDLKIVLVRSAEGAPTATWNYGNFIQVTVEFIIITFAVFILVKSINALKRREHHAATAVPPPPPADIVLLTEIRDLLKKIDKNP